jgi:uncharacterized protein (DUF2147 family)
MNIQKNILTALFLVIAMATMAQNKTDDILGTWLTNGDEPAKIEITKSKGMYYGKIVWLKYPEDDNGEKKDIKNPNASLRNQKINGLTIVKDFSFDGSKWTNGEIYDPESGSSYSCNITLKDRDTMEVRGYIGISLFGRTEIWKRI